MSKKIYMVEYIDDRDGLTMLDADPNTQYIEDMFYEGKLFKDVDLETPGKYRLYLTIDEGEVVTVFGKQEYVGWVDIDHKN